MDEKILIKSERYNLKKLIRILLIIGAILVLISIVSEIIDKMSWYTEHYNEYIKPYLKHGSKKEVMDMHIEFCHSNCPIKKGNAVFYGIYSFFDSRYSLLYSLIPMLIMGIICVIVYYALNSYELIISDKRIYGKVAFGKRVDLPLDSVSATSTIGLFKGVAVSTASGKISFLAIKNANEIYKVISNLLIERQQNKNVSSAASTPSSAPAGADTADQLMKYKELLDSGVITQEEFDAKKKQLLGL